VKNIKKQRKGEEHLVITLMLLPCIILLIFFVLYPLGWVLRYMFFEFNGLRTPKFIGLENFVRLFTRDGDYWHSVLNTFVYAGGKLLLTIPLAFILALMLNSRIKLQSVFRAVVFMPTIISTAVMSLVFYFMFNAYNGIVNQVLMKIAVIKEPINWFGRDKAMITAIIVAAWGAVGNYMIYFLSGLQTIPAEMYEATKLDGANYFQTMVYMVIPMMGPVMQTVLMLAIIISLKGFESIMVLTAGGPAGATDVMYLYIYRSFFPSQGEVVFAPQYGYGSAVALVTALITGIITIIYLRASNRMNNL
jgi:raffinose/stachyose/melibiose transport system permease protein